MAAAAARVGVTRGFLLGKFMPPHAGHMRLCETAQALVDRLTILVCWLPGDPLPGALRLRWMRELFPGARVIGHGEVVPQAPGDHPDFWPIWTAIVRAAHPEPVDLVFAGEDYGARLAAELGAGFVEVPRAAAPICATAVRAHPWGEWSSLPPTVRGHYARTICLHGPESSGKTVLAERLARHFGTSWIPEHARAYCLETPVNALTADDLETIARRQSAMIAAGRRWCDRRLFADTDALTTAAWSQMLLGHVPEGVRGHAPADLYLLLDEEAPWIDDGTRVFGQPERRRAFFESCEHVLVEAGARYVRIGGDWEQRFRACLRAVESLAPPCGPGYTPLLAGAGLGEGVPGGRSGTEADGHDR
ncbi:MAG TPA: AAA family ATPase [Allosphingosinicella sp.]|jgi:NadR type nicotinamide-nucleotide adenylyltransferase